MWEQLFSCHECNSFGAIPFLAIKMVSSSKPVPKAFFQYNLNSANRAKSGEQQADQHSVQCLRDQPLDLGYDLESQEQLNVYKQLPSNCGLGVLNLSSSNLNSTNNNATLGENVSSVQNLAHFCAACKPGYKATHMNQVFPHIKVKCE